MVTLSHLNNKVVVHVWGALSWPLLPAENAQAETGGSADTGHLAKQQRLKHVTKS